MADWWNNLSDINQIFYGVAVFFSVFFLWQLIAMLLGLGGDEVDAGADADVDADVGGDADMDGNVDLEGDAAADQFEHGAQADAAETMTAFKLLSIRSIITFFTLFTWGTALYLNNGLDLTRALIYGIGWGLAGMFIVALLFYWMRKLTETGNIKLGSCIGTLGTVYLDIPEGGFGEVRVTVSGHVSYVKARAAGAAALKSNTPVRVSRRLGQNTVEVEPVE